MEDADDRLCWKRLGRKCAKRAMCLRLSSTSRNDATMKLTEAETEDSEAALLQPPPTQADHYHDHNHYHHLREQQLQERVRQLNERLTSEGQPSPPVEIGQRTKASQEGRRQRQQQVRSSRTKSKLVTNANNMCQLKLIHLATMKVIMSRLNFHKISRHKSVANNLHSIIQFTILTALLLQLTCVARPAAASSKQAASMQLQAHPKVQIAQSSSAIVEDQRLQAHQLSALLTDSSQPPGLKVGQNDQVTKRHPPSSERLSEVRHMWQRRRQQQQRKLDDHPAKQPQQHRLSQSLRRHTAADDDQTIMARSFREKGGALSGDIVGGPGSDSVDVRKGWQWDERIISAQVHANIRGRDVPMDKQKQQVNEQDRGKSHNKLDHKTLSSANSNWPHHWKQQQLNETLEDLYYSASEPEAFELYPEQRHQVGLAGWSSDAASMGRSGGKGRSSKMRRSTFSGLLAPATTTISSIEAQLIVDSISRPKATVPARLADVSSGLPLRAAPNQGARLSLATNNARAAETQSSAGSAGAGSDGPIASDEMGPANSNNSSNTSEESTNESSYGDDGGGGDDDGGSDDDSSSDANDDDSDDADDPNGNSTIQCDSLEDILAARPSPAVGLVFGFNYSLIFVLGLLGNVITLYVLLCKGKKRTAQDILIANLACSDIMLCVFAVPITPKYLVRDGHWTLGSALCKVVSFAQSTSVYMSTYSLICIGYIRYRLIVHPLEVSMSKRTALLSCLGTWLVGIIVTLPYMLQVRLSPEDCPIKFCDEAWEKPYRFVFSLFTAFFQFMIPLGSVGFFNKKIYSRLDGRRQGGGAAGHANNPNDHQQHQHATNNNGKRANSNHNHKLHNSVDQLTSGQSNAHNSTPTSGATKQQQFGPPDVLAIKEQRQREKEKRMRKANNRLIFVVVIFAHSWLPLNLFNIAQDYFEAMSQWPYLTNTFLIVHQIACSSVCWNPILYAWMSETYRQDLRSALPRFVVAKFSLLLIEPSTASGHRSNADHHSHHHHHPQQQQQQQQQQQHHHSQQQHQQLQLQHSSSKQYHQVPTQAATRVDSNSISNSNHIHHNHHSISNESSAIHELLPATSAKTATSDGDQRHQTNGLSILEASSTVADSEDRGATCRSHGEYCDLISDGHNLECASGAEKFEQFSEIASDEIGVCSYADDDDDEEEDECDRANSSVGSCSGCQAVPGGCHEGAGNGDTGAPCYEQQLGPAVGTDSSLSHAHALNGSCQSPPDPSAPATGSYRSGPERQLDVGHKRTTPARLQHRKSTETSISRRAPNNNQGRHQHHHHHHHHHLQRQTSCYSSTMGDTVQIVV